jgi:AraC-like DNA-binding protein
MADSGNDTPRRLTLSSDDLPSNADERARRRYLEENVPHSRAADLDFAAPHFWRLDAVRFGSVATERIEGTLVRATRTSRHVATDGQDGFLIGMNLGGPASVRNPGRRELVRPRGSMTLVPFAEPGEIRSGAPVWLNVYLPRTRLTGMVRNVENLMASPVPPNTPAARHLRRYLRLVLSPGGVPHGDPHLDELVSTTLTDLTALALGARGEEAELARLRGVRAARLALATEEVQRGFSDPGFSVHAVAARLFVSPRTLQDLLHEAGASFTERVLELRLQKARQMLESPEQSDVQVARIAYACGFRDVSYFNRCFRRRFGAAPRELRT